MRCICALLVALGGVSNCWAVPIVFTHEGSGSGTLGGTPFANTSFVVTAQGDTANRQTDGFDVYSINHDSAQISLSGIGTFAFTSGTRTFVNQGQPIVGLSRGGDDGADLFNGPVNAAYGTWDMLSSIGPHSGSGNLLQWMQMDTRPAVTTTGGVLVFDSAQTQATFTAIIVPEPATAVLVLMAIVAWGVRFRCTRANRQ